MEQRVHATTLDCTRALVLAGLVWSVAARVSAQTPVAPAPRAEPAGGDSYVVYIAGRSVGREELAVVRHADGWVLRGSSRINPPVATVVRHVEVRYDGAWRPQSLSLDGSVQGKDVSLETTFAGGKATNRVKEGDETIDKVDDVSPDAVVLSNVFFGSYAALAARLLTVPAGAEVKLYIAPQAEIPVAISAVADERIETPRRTFTARRYSLTFKNPGGDVTASLWAELGGGFVRLSVPAQSLEVAREDVASAAVRMSAFSIPGDESVRVPANGFNIAATLTRPALTGRPQPAVVIIGGAGPADRDGTVAGIPMLGQVARDLVNAGFVVVRYDKRGVGQSGGRAETATLTDYAEDARAVVTWLRKSRKREVDGRRIALVGHSEGAWVAMRLATLDKDIAALVMTGAASETGGALVVEQQQHLLGAMQVPDEEKKAKAELQAKITAAATGVGSWDGVPKELREQADTPWFASYLAFDPAALMKDVRQPILLVQGERDTQVPSRHADRLAELARGRKRQAAVEVVKVPGVNHLLVPAQTGEIAEYASLTSQQVSTDATAAMARWLSSTLAATK